MDSEDNKVILPSQRWSNDNAPKGTFPTNTFDLVERVSDLETSKADLVNGKVPDEQLPETTFPFIAVEGLERAVADAINHLLGRVTALEEILSNATLDTFRFEQISVVSSLKFKGAELILLGTGAPSITPDFIGQIYIKTDATVGVYISTGIANSGDWKSV
jgi:hypothetical protein